MRVTLVSHDSVFSRYLASRLVESGAVDRLVIERRSASPHFYWRKVRRVGLGNAAFQFWLNRQMHRSGARHLPQCSMPHHQRVETIRECRFADDELVIGFGTSIVSAETLAGVPQGILNLHTGWLPAYRGVKSEFWSLAKHDRERLGWTLHYMTPRLDDGDIVLRGRIATDTNDPGHLRALLLIDAASAMAELIASVRRQGFAVIPREPQGVGAYYTTPTLGDWWRFRRTR